MNASSDLKVIADAIRAEVPGDAGEKAAAQVAEMQQQYPATATISGDGTTLTVLTEIDGGEKFTGTADSEISSSETAKVTVYTSNIDQLYTLTTVFFLTLAAPGSCTTICVFSDAKNDVLGTFITDDAINASGNLKGKGSWS